MREIKFRAFDELNKEMRFSDKNDGEFYVNLKGVLYMYGIPKTNKYYKNYNVMQFTGLKDKNGIDRYEGDIIRRNTGYTFLEEKKYFSLGDKNNAKCLGYDYHPDDEVIGNIYENPELIK